MKNLTIGVRIGAAAGLLVLIIVSIAVYAHREVTKLAFLAGVAKTSVESTLFMVERQVDHLQWVRGLELYLLVGQKFTGQLDPHKCKFGQWLYGSQAGTRTVDAETAKLLTDIEAPHARLHRSARKIMEARAEGDADEAKQLFTAETLPALASTADLLIKLRARYDAIRVSQGGEAANDLEREARLAGQWLFWMSVLAVLTGVGCTLYVGRMITNDLLAAAGELSRTAGQVASAADQVAASSQALAEGAAEQASSLDSTSASTEEVSTMARSNTENTATASSLASRSEASMVETDRALVEMVDSINEIGASGDKISSIIRVIDEIAFQTAILALNAAVEAARAGAAGVSFAVVAGEIRNLAERCSKAAKDTSALIEESTALSRQGKDKVDRIVAAVRRMSDDSRAIKTLVEQVNAGSQEQARGITELARAMSQMRTTAQSQAASAEQGAAAAEELNAQSRQLRGVVVKLTKMVVAAETPDDH